jgi:hypothetical protein
MTDDEQLESLMTNYTELEDGEKDKLLLVGKNLLNIKSLVKEKENKKAILKN